MSRHIRAMTPAFLIAQAKACWQRLDEHTAAAVRRCRVPLGRTSILPTVTSPKKLHNLIKFGSTARSRENSLQNDHRNTNWNLERSSQFSFQTNHLKRNSNFDHAGFRFEIPMTILGVLFSGIGSCWWNSSDVNNKKSRVLGIIRQRYLYMYHLSLRLLGAEDPDHVRLLLQFLKVPLFHILGSGPRRIRLWW